MALFRLYTLCKKRTATGDVCFQDFAETGQFIICYDSLVSFNFANHLLVNVDPHKLHFGGKLLLRQPCPNTRQFQLLCNYIFLIVKLDFLHGIPRFIHVFYLILI